ncbi:MAG: DUF1307 domain-containing protein [Longicatena sp.]
MNSKKIILLFVLCIAGCSNSNDKNKESVMNCKLQTKFNIMDVESNSKIYYVGDKAIKNLKNETVTFYKSKDVTNEEMTAFIEEYVETLKKQKASTKDLDGVTMNFTVDESVITIKGEIDYTKIDVDKMKETDPNIKDLLTDNKISVSKLKSSSEALGSVCSDLEGVK